MFIFSFACFDTILLFHSLQDTPQCNQRRPSVFHEHVHPRAHNLTPDIPPSQLIGDSTMLALFDENDPQNIPIPHVHIHQGP